MQISNDRYCPNCGGLLRNRNDELWCPECQDTIAPDEALTFEERESLRALWEDEE